MIISQGELKRLLSYDPESGVFTRRVGAGRWPAGSIAGSLDTTPVTGGYIKIYLRGRRYRAHRLAWLYMTGEWPDQIDHISHDRADNRWSNLRDVAKTENSRNRTLNSNNKSGFRGVSWHKQTGKWLAYINPSPRFRKSIGYYDTIIDAVAARLSEERDCGYHENHGAR